MSDPVEWLSNRLDEVEALATAAEIDAGSPWRVEENWGGESDVVEAASPLPGFTHPEYRLWSGEGSDYVSGSPKVAAHVAGMDPAMVLRLVAATRALLVLHGQTLGCVDYMVACMSCGTADEYAVDWPCATVKALAAGWGWTDE